MRHVAHINALECRGAMEGVVWQQVPLHCRRNWRNGLRGLLTPAAIEAYVRDKLDEADNNTLSQNPVLKRNSTLASKAGSTRRLFARNRYWVISSVLSMKKGRKRRDHTEHPHIPLALSATGKIVQGHHFRSSKRGQVGAFGYFALAVDNGVGQEIVAAYPIRRLIGTTDKTAYLHGGGDAVLNGGDDIGSP